MDILFDYECEKCNWQFEESLPADKSETTVCPKCGAEAKKVFLKPVRKHVSWSQWKVGLNQD